MTRLSGVTHMMVNTVSSMMGTVAAPPESEVSEKLPSELVIAHDVTPCVFQNTEALAPIVMVFGTVHMSTFGSMSGAEDVAGGVNTGEVNVPCCPPAEEVGVGEEIEKPT